jgi:hypothetical protein
MSDLLQKAISEISKLPEQQQDVIAAWILDRIAEETETEAAWEARVVTQALGDALLPDGSIDFDKLDAESEVVYLDDYPEGENTGEP